MITIAFINPITHVYDQMPMQMILAYVPYASMLNLEQAAKVAAIRDDEAATNLLLSIRPTEPQILEGCGLDPLAIEPPSLR